MRRKEQFGSVSSCLNCQREHCFSVSQQFPVLKYWGFTWGVGRGWGWVSQWAEAALRPLASVCAHAISAEGMSLGFLGLAWFPPKSGAKLPCAGPGPSEGHLAFGFCLQVAPVLQLDRG